MFDQRGAGRCDVASRPREKGEVVTVLGRSSTIITMQEFAHHEEIYRYKW